MFKCLKVFIAHTYLCMIAFLTMKMNCTANNIIMSINSILKKSNYEQNERQKVLACECTFSTFCPDYCNEFSRKFENIIYKRPFDEDKMLI